ncbi:MAG: C-GCAxxG-C-C family protein [Chloroflexota bacterium]|nr:C-GCAxxG-C-C family protein [Chloroflexota bacterium]
MMLAVGEHVLGDLDLRMVKMATGFAGGVGDTQQEMCGTLSAGVMLIGALHGRNSLGEDDWSALDLATRYRERFAEELGDTRCSPLYKRVHAPGGLGSCALVVERAALILLELLAEQRRRR